MFYKLDENKNVVESTLEEWRDFIEGRLPANYKHVGDVNINGKRISTVFLGLYHGCFEHEECDCAPTVFETMVFDEGGHDIYMKRYATYKDAEEGHSHAIEWVKNGCKKDE
jgi:hypothetical protein